MKRSISLIVISFVLGAVVSAAPRSIPMNVPAERGMEQNVEKPQMARDLEGLDPKEGSISKGLRGSFTIRHYISGPWKGGTAVIELASDSSYAEVRIFDEEGNLQRVYSIQPKAQNARFNDAQMRNPVEMVKQGTSGSPSAQGGDENVNVTRSRAREAAVEAQTAEAIQSEKEARSSEFTPRGRRGTVSSIAGDIREEGPPEVEATAPARESVQASTPRKRTIRVRRKRHHKKTPRNSLDTPLSGASEKEKEEDEYYYEDVVVVEKAAPAPVSAKAEPPAPRVTEERPLQVARVEPIAVPPSPRASPPPVKNTAQASGDLDHTSQRTAPAAIPSPAGSRSVSSSSAYDEEGLPDVNDAVKENAADNQGSKAKVLVLDEKKSAASEKEARKAAAAAEKEARKAAEAAEKEARKAAEVEAKKAAAVAEEESRKAAAAERESHKASAPEAIPNSSPSNAKPIQVVALPGAPVQVPPLGIQEPTRAQPATAEVNLTEAQKAAAKLESDAWTPKPSKAAPSDAELGLTDLGESKSARGSGKRSKKGENYDEVVPMSEQASRGAQIGAGDAWKPGSATPKLSAKEEQTLAMINTLKAQPQVPVAKVSRDINNPEEGVKPFYSLEKYSGAQFGRHREFERRVMYKQNKASSVKGYEFYIDEVDRKQEKHYLYYYKIDPKTKKAKLIATEKHEKVTFLGNYDIGSEDKGKISKE